MEFNKNTKNLNDNDIFNLCRQINHYTLDTIYDKENCLKFLELIENSGKDDFNSLTTQIENELKRVAWSQEKLKSYLLLEYSSKSIQLLSDEQLSKLFNHLKKQET